MNLTIIAAISENGIIGTNGQIPWRIPEDMKRFRQLTIPHPVIMGRKTYESIDTKFRPLSERKNIVLSRSWQGEEGIYMARTMQEALDLASGNQAFVAGGGDIYNMFLSIADSMEITRVHQHYQGDTNFPTIDWDEWELENDSGVAKSKTGIDYSFLSYSRKKSS